MSQELDVDPGDAAFARKALLQWFENSDRKFPWRYDTNPYHILIAEMMLRRTQARQVPETYQAFLAKYPDLASLDRASENEISEILYRLGLRWRAANFKALASELMTRYNGEIPSDRDSLMTLPGVGPYVADAIQCFAFGQISVLADTNTVRVAARYFGFEYNPESRRRPAVVHAISKLIDSQSPARSNYALLDFAALVCRARIPDHENCPLLTRCKYYKQLRSDDRHQDLKSLTPNDPLPTNQEFDES